ncbi:hypothetical protein AB0B31_34775 [Catellatospora citrea]|uniref:hypothetical protein n=1 Tax=Catellatospora citrea TaxID=53366 RepID=UPI0033FE232C
MSINDDDLTTKGTPGAEGPDDAGADERVDPAQHDGGADGGADLEGPLDAGADDAVDSAEHDGGADGGA